MKNDALGDRMKFYESRETERCFLPYIPVYARIDGRGFSKFTRDAVKPFDPIINAAMNAAAIKLVETTGAKIAFHQSDEISLVWTTREPGEEMFFKGKVQKMTSVLAGLTTAAFIQSLLESQSDWVDAIKRLPHFDARVVQLPNREEAANMILWRELDATKNAISMAAYHYHSHKSLQGKNSVQKLAMLLDSGIVFEDEYPVAFRRGTYLQRVIESRTLTDEEWLAIPEGKRPEKDRSFTRASVRIVAMPPLRTIANPTEVLFEGAMPILKTQVL